MPTTPPLILTPYGTGSLIGKTPDGRLVVIIPKAALTTPPPNYRGGPCVTVIIKPVKEPDPR